jgi:GTP cyclohydrolase III
LVNRINDSNKVETRLAAALEGKEGDALATAEKSLEDAKKATKKLQEQKRTEDESFAELSQEDATGRVGILELDLKNIDTRISDLAAETKYE